MSILRNVALAAALCLVAPTALAQMKPPARAPSDDPRGSSFGCTDGSKIVLAFAETGNGSAALVYIGDASYRLTNVAPEQGIPKVVWSDGEHSLTWSPGVQLMWMASDTHLMCGRDGGHKH